MNDTNVIPLLGLNSKQWETLLQMLKNKNESGSIEKMNGKYFWIIDSGASHHMTGTLEDLSNLKEIIQWPVELPDGNIAMAKKRRRCLFQQWFCFKKCFICAWINLQFAFCPTNVR